MIKFVSAAMVAAAAGAFLAAGFAAVPAEAHGPTRQKVAETIEINAAPEKVWAVIGNYQDMSWHPAVAKTEGEGGNAENATRTLTLASGGQIKTQLLKYDDAGRSFRYMIPEVDVKVLPVNNYSATISVEGADGKSTVTWRGAFYRGFMNNDPPPELNEEAAIKAVTGMYKAGLEALKAKLEAGG